MAHRWLNQPGSETLNMAGRQLIHCQSAPERERPDAALLAQPLAVAKSASGRLERGQSVANSDGAKVPTYRTPPNLGFRGGQWGCQELKADRNHQWTGGGSRG